MKRQIKSLLKDELADMIKPSFRAKQIFGWIYRKNIENFDDMQNLPKNLRNDLAEEFVLKTLEIVNKEQSRDGSVKYLFRCFDGGTVESVLLPMKREIADKDGNIKKEARYTICISTQIGCKIGCSFCLTAKGGFNRDLTPAEIVDQVLIIRRDNDIKPNRRVNVVYMGMGEPLDNLDNVAKAVKIFSDSDGLAIGTRRQTISTSGLSHQIEKLGKMDLGVLLAISLHAVDDNIRDELMPINRAYNIDSVINAVRNFPIDQRKRVMFEYLMIKDLNDDIRSAKKLVKLLHGIKAKVNLIFFNPYPGSHYDRPSSDSVEKFKSYMNAHGIICTIRESKGLDISAACGQLKEKNLDELD